MIYSHIFDELISTTLDGHAEPHAAALERFDSVAAAPIPDGILHIVQEDERVNFVHEIEEAAPRQIAWLDNANSAHVAGHCGAVFYVSV